MVKLQRVLVPFAVVFTLVLATLAVFVGIYPQVGESQGNQTARTSCTPANIAVFSNRIHIKCSQALQDGTQFFAVATSDPSVDRILSVLNVAIVSPGLKVVLDYATSPSDNPPGCLTSDCRKMLSIFLAR
jgi:hypothetical protein